MAFAEPMPKSQLFWIGTLMRLATGFDSFLASSAAAAFSSVVASCANSAVVVVKASALTSAAARRSCLCVVFIMVCAVYGSLVAQSAFQVLQELRGGEEASGPPGCSALATASRSARLATGLRRSEEH